MSSYDYDLFVIGSGPAGQRAAVQAAKLGKRVAIAEMQTVVGTTTKRDPTSLSTVRTSLPATTFSTSKPYRRA